MVERRETVSEIAALHKEFNKLFDQLTHFENSESRVELGEWFPSVDVFETRNQLVIKVEAPGMSKNELAVTFYGHKMVISGEKKQPREEKSVDGYLCLERSFGKFSRAIYIDAAVDMTKANATLAQGVLTVAMPKLKDRRGSAIRLPIKEQEA